MDKDLIRTMDKSIAISTFEKEDIDKSLYYMTRYFDELEEKIQQNSDNKRFLEEKKESIQLFEKRLLHAAKTFFATEQWVDSIKCCRELIKFDTKDTSVYKHASFAHKNLEQYDIALNLMLKYAEIDSEDPLLRIYLAEAYTNLKTLEGGYKAVEYYKSFLQDNPEDLSAINAIGNVYSLIINNEKPKFDEQLEYYHKAYSINPKDKYTLRHLAITYSKTGDQKKCAEYYQKYYKLYKDTFNYDELFEYAAHLISTGNFLKGWKYLDNRFLKETGATFLPEIKEEKWDGVSDIKDKTLLIHAEQGFGDVVMFIRFAKLMKKHAKKIIAVVQDELEPLFLESNLGFDVYPVSTTLDKLDFDVYIPLISIPRVLQITAEDMPFYKGYLTVIKDRVEAYKESYIRKGKFNIGICFQGAEHGKGENRDIDWKYIKEFATIPNVQIYCLKKEKDRNDFKDIVPNKEIICLGKTWENFADTAAAIKSMDLIITTDNVILNLAGALGVKTLALYNAHREYRWYGTEEGRNVWYASVTPIQAKMQFAWDDVIARARTETIKYIKSKKNQTKH